MTDPDVVNTHLALGVIYYAASCALTGAVWRGLSVLASRSARPVPPAGTSSSSNLLEGHRAQSNFLIRFIDAVYAALAKTGLRLLPWSADTDYVQVLIVFFLLLYHVLASFIGIPSSKEMPWLKAASLRCGLLTYADVVLMPLLSGRNNLLSLCTGIPYVRFNALHRMLGMIIMIWTILHGVFISAYLWQIGMYTKYLHAPAQVLTYGIAASVVLGVLMILPAFYLIRLRRYEMFLVCHVAGAAALLAILLRHQTKMSDQAWIWTAVAIWAADRTMRFLRICYLHLFSFHGRVEFSVEVIANAVLLRGPLPSHFPIAAGSHVFAMCFDRVFLSRPWLMLESHPFSVAHVATGGGELVLLCRVKGAFTKRLAQVAEQSGKICALVEGGYANDALDAGFHENLLLAGGTGLSCIQTLFADAVWKASRGKGGAMQRLHLVWAASTFDSIGWLCDELLAIVAIAQAVPSLQTKVDIYITRAKAESLEQALDSSQLDPRRLDAVRRLLSIPARSFSVASLPSITSEKPVDRNAIALHFGRPQFGEIMQDACASGGRIIVTACGPSTFTRSAQTAARQACATPRNAIKGAPVVHFVQASF